MTLNMLRVLNQVEEELPDLLERYDWKSLDVDYFPPRVERVWRQHGDYRICLHRIYATDEDVLVHTHRWPSAMRILNGQYEMNIGHREGFPNGNDFGAPPMLTKDLSSSKMIVTAGSAYEMTDPCLFHSVKPFDCEYALTLLVMGPLYDHPLPSVQVKRALDSLEDNEVKNIINEFKEHYNYGQI